MTDTNLDDLSRQQLVERLQEADSARATARDETRRTLEELKALRKHVTDEFKALVQEQELSLDRAREACENLGVDAPISKFNAIVTVTLKIRGFQAADSDEAESEIEDAVQVDFGTGEYEGWDFEETVVDIEEVD